MLSYVIPLKEEKKSGHDGMNTESIAPRQISPPNNLGFNFDTKYLYNKLTEANEYFQEPCSQQNSADSYNCALHNPSTTAALRDTHNKHSNNNSINVNININVRTSDDDDFECDEEGNVRTIERDESSVYNIVTSSANCENTIISKPQVTQEILSARKNSTKKPRLGKLGTKTVGLKRVSFGSSKGSMVETLIFETPTPLSEHAEQNFRFECDTEKCNSLEVSNVGIDDSGVDVQEKEGHSLVRVSIYQSNQPQQIFLPCYLTNLENILDSPLNKHYNYNCESIMAASSLIYGYDRQQSTDSGWENPFRPGGDLSREADEIVKMISGGKPITPTEDDHTVKNGKKNTCGTEATESVTKRNVSQSQSTQNGAAHKTQTGFNPASKMTESNKITSLVQISKQVVPGPTSASHVLIDEKKNKRKGCCVIQ